MLGTVFDIKNKALFAVLETLGFSILVGIVILVMYFGMTTIPFNPENVTIDGTEAVATW